MEHEEVQEAVDNVTAFYADESDADICGAFEPADEHRAYACTRPPGHGGALHVAAIVEVDGDGVEKARVHSKWRAYLPLPIKVLGTDNGNLVWVEHEPVPERTESGIIVPNLSPAGGFDDSPNSKVFARVVAVGPGKRIPKYGRGLPPHVTASKCGRLWYVDGAWREVSTLRLGDRVVLGKHEGHLVQAFGRELRCVYEHAIDGVVEG